jgi:hypothetical protein
LCLKNGQLTAASNATIDAALAAQTGSLAILVRNLGAGDTALIVRTLAPREVSSAMSRNLTESNKSIWH